MLSLRFSVLNIALYKRNPEMKANILGVYKENVNQKMSTNQDKPKTFSLIVKSKKILYLNQIL